MAGMFAPAGRQTFEGCAVASHPRRLIMFRKLAFAATAAVIAAAALSSPALAGGGGGGGGKHGKFFNKPYFKHHYVHAPVVYYDPCYVTKWVKTPFGLKQKTFFVCY
jgi:hypothetical protein